MRQVAYYPDMPKKPAQVEAPASQPGEEPTMFPWRKVRQRFDAGGWSRSRFAEFSGLNVRTLDALLTGRRPTVSYETIVALRKGLGVDWAFFFTADIPADELPPLRRGRPQS